MSNGIESSTFNRTTVECKAVSCLIIRLAVHSFNRTTVECKAALLRLINDDELHF